MKESLLNQLNATKEYFDRSTRCLQEEHSGHSPAPDMYTAAQQVAHVARTNEWFLQGATRPEGYDLDFPAMDKEARAVSSLAEARKWLEKSQAAVAAFIESTSMEDLAVPIEGPLMTGFPRHSIVGGIVEHTAHHRGALTVYSRTLGLTPSSPYMDA